MEFLSYLKENTNFKIYLDMDGVLSDFEKSFKAIDGRTTKQVEKEGDPAFWKHVEEGGLVFWSEMPWTKDGKKLWNYVKNKDVSLLSAPARRLPDSIRGKQIWVGRELGNVDLILKRASEKQEYANPNSILIDDQEKNIRKWKSAGGIGILYKNAGQAIKQLKKMGI